MGQGSPLPASKLVGACGSPRTGAGSFWIWVPRKRGSFSTHGTIPLELDGSKRRGGPEIPLFAAFEAKATPSF